MTKHLESTQPTPNSGRVKRRPTCPPTCPPKPIGRRRKRRREGGRAGRSSDVHGRRRSFAAGTRASVNGSHARLLFICFSTVVSTPIPSRMVILSARMERRKNREFPTNELLKAGIRAHGQALGEGPSKRKRNPSTAAGPTRANGECKSACAVREGRTLRDIHPAIMQPSGRLWYCPRPQKAARIGGFKGIGREPWQ